MPVSKEILKREETINNAQRSDFILTAMSLWKVAHTGSKVFSDGGGSMEPTVGLSEVPVMCLSTAVSEHPYAPAFYVLTIK